MVGQQFRIHNAQYKAQEARRRQQSERARAGGRKRA